MNLNNYTDSTNPSTVFIDLNNLLSYINLISLVFILVWSLLSLISIYYLWYAFNLFQAELRDISFEIIDFRTNQTTTKPREIYRLVNIDQETPSKLVLSV